MVRPKWLTAVTSTPFRTTALRIESDISAFAEATVMGPTPAISERSPGTRCPLIRALWSIRTWTMALGPELEDCPSQFPCTARVTSASAA